MGIKNLLPTLKAIQKQKHIKDFKGQTAGIDALCWMHQGAAKYARDLTGSNGHKLKFCEYSSLEKLVSYCLQKLRTLQMNGVKPYLVFDGARLGMKARVEEDRRRLRTHANKQAQQLLEQGCVAEANKKFIESVAINGEMIHFFIQQLRLKNVKHIVSPYESDAQLAYLFKSGEIDFVVTEDSDLLAYGVQQVFTKMDVSGHGLFIDLTCLPECTDYQMPDNSKFSQEMLLRTCILSGCDYHPGVPHVGFKKALKLVKHYKGDIRAIVSDLESQGRIDNAQTYLGEFRKAELTFKHQIVYDAKYRRERYLLEPVPEGVDLSFLGKLKPDHVAVQISRGDINPMTLELYQFSLNNVTLAQEAGTDQNDDRVGKVHDSNQGFLSANGPNFEKKVASKDKNAREIEKFMDSAVNPSLTQNRDSDQSQQPTEGVVKSQKFQIRKREKKFQVKRKHQILLSQTQKPLSSRGHSQFKESESASLTQQKQAPVMVSYLRRKQQPTVPQAMKDFFAQAEQQKKTKKKSQDYSANLVKQVSMNNEAARLARMKSRRNGDPNAKYQEIVSSDNDGDGDESFILRSASKLAKSRNRVAHPDDVEEVSAIVGDFESYAPGQDESQLPQSQSLSEVDDESEVYISRILDTPKDQTQLGRSQHRHALHQRVYSPAEHKFGGYLNYTRMIAQRNEELNQNQLSQFQNSTQGKYLRRSKPIVPEPEVRADSEVDEESS